MSLRPKRIAPGHYVVSTGRGHSRRTFEMFKVTDSRDGYLLGWAVREIGISFLTIRNGWTMLADGLARKSEALAVIGGAL